VREPERPADAGAVSHWVDSVVLGHGRRLGRPEAYREGMAVAVGPEVAWAPHTLLIHRDESHRRASVGAWVQRGLERGERIFYTTVDGDTHVVAELTHGGVDVPRAVRDGQLTFVASEDFFPGAQQAALVRRALAEGYPGVRLSARADPAIQDVGAEEFRVIDHGMDELCATMPVLVLCQYDAVAATGTADATGLTTAVDNHLDAFQDGQMRVQHRGDQVSVGGEVDLVSADVLAHALRRMVRPGHGSEMVLDLAELAFIDVAGCRALVTGTEAVRGDGGRVFLRGVGGHVQKVMALLGIDRQPGLDLA
jgi:anti-anti-sigma factor